MTPAAYAVLNLQALQHNLQRVHECAPEAKVMAVIKANAYGHGLLRVASSLQNVDAFAVARVGEGIWLRKSGIRCRITVLEGFTCSEELHELSSYGLEAVIHTREQLDLLEASNIEKKLSVWLKHDTGMNRLGFTAQDLAMAYRRLDNCQQVIRPINLMTHLANADDLDNEKTRHQINLFSAAVKSYRGERSIANSAGVLGWHESLTDWVRPGVMLYGISPFPNSCGEQMRLKPVMSLHSRLIALKQIQKGDAVGYGGSWIASQTTLLGVAAVGYGDGYPRQAKAGTPVLVNGVRVPLIGRVSMDMITIDLSNCPDAKLGDPVTLWGEGLAVEEIARDAGTISYTLLCGITQRVEIVEQ
jgi:alanine racemase